MPHAEPPAALFSPMVEQAMRMASRYHRTQQRKSSDLPYLSHPASVALILAKAGFPQDHVLAAALLHDVVEDTDGTLDELAAEFPADVVGHVAAASEQKVDDTGRKRAWQDRKSEHIGRVARSAVESRAIVLADKLHNLGSMLYELESGHDVWPRFNASRDEVLWYHCMMVDRAWQQDDRLAGLATECLALLERIDQLSQQSASRDESD